MINFLTPKEMYACDEYTINEIGIKSAILMENAASAAANEINNLLESSQKILILCGSGNNGGDGFALARKLDAYHYVDVLYIGDESKMSDETKHNFKLLDKLEISNQHFEFDKLSGLDSDYDIVVDSLIGVGTQNELKGDIVPLLKWTNDIDALKIAIDVPSGLDAEKGYADENSFIADLTITMYAPKTGMVLNDGPDLCGDILIANLGLNENAVFNHSRISSFEDEDITRVIPEREENSSKFDHGRVLVVAGSNSMPGAAAMASNAAVIAGSGLVHLASTSFHNELMSEVIIHPCSSSEHGTISIDNFEMINTIANKCDVILFGPGLGLNIETLELVMKLIESNQDKKIILDADAIKVIDQNSQLQSNFIITPHIGELSNLSDTNRNEIDENRVDFTFELAKKLNCNVLLKGSPSIISEGDWAYVNTTGNPGLAKGGSGDVLSGIIAAILAQGVNEFEATALGAYLHGKAADNYIEENNLRTLNAMRLLDELRKIEY